MSLQGRFDHFRATRIARFMGAYIQPAQAVLDFGAGSMSVARAVHRELRAQVVGVDVLPVSGSCLPFSVYDGVRLPFARDTFDHSYVAFVLHHARQPQQALEECLRVTRGFVIILEDIFRTPAGRAALTVFDWIGNRPFSGDMRLPYNFRTDAEWRAVFQQLGGELVDVRPVRPNPWRPTAHRMYVIT